MEESPSSKWHWGTEERFKTDPGKLSPGAEADTRWSKGSRELLFIAGKRELAEAGGQGHALGRDQMAHDSAVQQCSWDSQCCRAWWEGGTEKVRRDSCSCKDPGQVGRPWLRQPSDRIYSGFHPCWSCGCFCWATSSEGADGLSLLGTWGKINRGQWRDKWMSYFPPC